jgi:hypothetical protein
MLNVFYPRFALEILLLDWKIGLKHDVLFTQYSAGKDDGQRFGIDHKNLFAIAIILVNSKVGFHFLYA